MPPFRTSSYTNALRLCPLPYKTDSEVVPKGTIRPGLLSFVGAADASAEWLVNSNQYLLKDLSQRVYRVYI